MGELRLGTVKVFNHHMHKSFLWLLLIETLVLVLAFHLGGQLYWHIHGDGHTANFDGMFSRAVLFALCAIAAMMAMGLYQPHLREGTTGIVLRTTGAFIITVLTTSMVFYFMPGLYIWRGVFVYAVAIAYSASLLSRWCFERFVSMDQLKSRVLVYGTGKAASSILRSMRRKTDRRSTTFEGFCRIPGEADQVDERYIIAVDDSLLEFCNKRDINRIVVAPDSYRELLPMEQLLECKLHNIRVMDVATFMESETGKIMLDHIKPSTIVFSEGFRQNSLATLLKRVFDIAASLLLIILTWPLLLLTIIAIWIEDGFGAPIIYRQTRVGLYGKHFDVMKIRSMSVNAESDGKAQWAQKNDARITKVGSFIRRTRIDELPQVFNVLAGDMAFVGPRPERPEFVEQLAASIPYYNVRHAVKPGITGWAQLRYPYGASEHDSRQKLQYDLYYVKNASLFLDFTILLTTFEVVVHGNGVR
ncbi:MAG: sugar transferase [Gammaproteobacteria bacterium]|nr:MAG: sugar transferase [Gammaproteobacteria bacterium]